jgi:hypothetical protein
MSVENWVIQGQGPVTLYPAIVTCSRLLLRKTSNAQAHDKGVGYRRTAGRNKAQSPTGAIAMMEMRSRVGDKKKRKKYHTLQ